MPTPDAPPGLPRPDAVALRAASARHLFQHFAAMDAVAAGRTPMIVRGEGCTVWDTDGRSWFDGLAGLFTVQVGYGRPELADAAATQARELSYFPVWSAAHPMAALLAQRMAEAAPGDLNRVFFTSGGSEAVESAFKLARAYWKAVGAPAKTKVISRNLAYHGTTMGALSITGLPAFKTAFEPLVPGAVKVANTNWFRPALADAAAAGPAAFSAAAADAIEQAILTEGADSIAAVFLEPVQNAGGCFAPPDGYWQRVREICDRHDVLLVSDEVICGFGRLGHLYACERLGVVPDMVTSAKGMTSGYAPLGAVTITDRVAAPFVAGDASFAHGLTFGGHPLSCAVSMANLDLFDKLDLCASVLERQAGFERRLRDLAAAQPAIGDVRGAGFFWALEIVRPGVEPSAPQSRPDAVAVKAFLAPWLNGHGLLCRVDDRGDSVLQLSPPLVATEEQLDTCVATIADGVDALRSAGILR